MAGYAPAPADPARLWNTLVNFAKDGLKSVQLVKYWTQLLSYHEGSTVTGLTRACFARLESGGIP
jgi:hypothetical protein